MPRLILGPILGGLSPNSVNLWGRADGPGRLYAWLGKEASLGDAWLAGESQPLAAENGFAGVAPVAGLSPDTRYYYSLSLDADFPDPSATPYPGFITFPQPGLRASFAFAFGSCFRPASAQSGQVFYRIAERLQPDDLRFILMIGDQIYADDYLFNGIGKVATSLDDYRAVYAYTFAQPSFRSLLARLPAFMTLDDHEVDDDWTWINRQRTVAQIPVWDRAIRLLNKRQRSEWQIPLPRVQAALKAYWEHQGMHAPHFTKPPSLDPAERYRLAPDDPGSLAYTFTYGAAAFFVLDTRTMRVKSSGERSMLGEGQWKALEEWLLIVRDAFPVKFLVTSCSLLFYMWLDIPRDRWSGFPRERDRLLNLLAAHRIEGVYLLAGDLHSAHAIRADLSAPPGGSLPLWEFCSSPFEQAPNRLASRTYWPLCPGPVERQRLYFSARQPNFGVVRVDFSAPGPPRVKFEIYGASGELLGEVSSMG